MISITLIRSDEVELKELAEEATAFLTRQPWCLNVKQGYIARFWPGILGIFYFDIESGQSGAENNVWIIVGDIPPAYIDPVSCPTGEDALAGYVGEVNEWIANAKENKPLTEFIPILRRHSLSPVANTKETIEMLDSRMRFIENELIPQYCSS